jgi:hypothetical protein
MVHYRRSTTSAIVEVPIEAPAAAGLRHFSCAPATWTRLEIDWAHAPVSLSEAHLASSVVSGPHAHVPTMAIPKEPY